VNPEGVVALIHPNPCPIFASVATVDKEGNQKTMYTLISVCCLSLRKSSNKIWLLLRSMQLHILFDQLVIATGLLSSLVILRHSEFRKQSPHGSREVAFYIYPLTQTAFGSLLYKKAISLLAKWLCSLSEPGRSSCADPS